MPDALDYLKRSIEQLDTRLRNLSVRENPTTGAQGPQGVQGAQGNQGFQGSQGTQGVQGSTGSQGPQGFQGNQGFQGLTGAQGSQGTQGTQGVQGATGSQGFQGNQGTQGNQGNQGTQGTQGTQGPQGAPGGAFDATVPSAVDQTAATGSSSFGTRIDHVHTLGLSTRGPVGRLQGWLIIPEGNVTDNGAGTIAFGSTVIVMNPLSGNWWRIASGSYALGLWDTLYADCTTANARTTVTPAVKTWVDSDVVYPNIDRVVLAQRNGATGLIHTRFSLPAAAAQVYGRRTINALTSNTTIDIRYDLVLCNASGGAFTVTLPTAVGNSGVSFTIKKTDSSQNAVTIATTSSQNIDFATTYVLTYSMLNGPRDRATVTSDGTQWWVTG